MPCMSLQLAHMEYNQQTRCQTNLHEHKDWAAISVHAGEELRALGFRGTLSCSTRVLYVRMSHSWNNYLLFSINCTRGIEISSLWSITLNVGDCTGGTLWDDCEKTRIFTPAFFGCNVGCGRECGRTTRSVQSEVWMVYKDWRFVTGKKCIQYYLCYHSLLNANLIRMLMNGYRSLLAHVNEGISWKHANKDDQSGGG